MPRLLFGTLLTRCKAKPDCSTPGYPRRRLLIIVNWRIAQHLHFLSYPVAHECQGNVRGSNVQGEMSVPREAMSFPRCIGVVNRNRWRSTSCRNCSRDPDHAHLGNTHSTQDKDFTWPTRVQNLKSLALAVAEKLHVDVVSNSKTGHLTLTTPLSGKIFHLQVGACYDKSMYQIWSL